MKASCTWGEGPDVMVVLEGTPIMSYEHPVNVSEEIDHFEGISRDDEKLCWCTHGFIRQGSFDLTAQEAFDLAVSLISAARMAVETDLSYRNFVIKEQNDRRLS